MLAGQGERTLGEHPGWRLRGVCGLCQERHVWAVPETALSAKPKILELLGGHWELQVAPSRVFAR